MVAARPFPGVVGILAAWVLTLGLSQFAVAEEPQSAPPAAAGKWDPQQAAKYLDDRAAEWVAWPHSARSHESNCISCHTTLPYLLVRGALGRRLGENEPPAPAAKLLADVRRRVNAWNDVQPWYTSSDEKSVESRGTEAVINALLLSVSDAAASPIASQADTKAALGHLWSTQRGEGPAKGSWAWLDFDLEPWESEHAEYWGATLAAIAQGIAPQSAADREAAATELLALRAYLRARLDDSSLSLHNRAMLLWAAHRMEGLLEPAEARGIADALLAAQRDDGSWSLADLGQWKQEHTESDAYATGLCAVVLHGCDEGHYRESARKAADWLARHQDRRTGAWPTRSLNQERDVETNVGKFTQDAATAFAVLALVEIER